MESKALAAIADALGLQGVELNDRFEDFGLDSLEFLEFLLDVQRRLGVDIPDGKISGLNTVADLLKVIDELHVSA